MCVCMYIFYVYIYTNSRDLTKVVLDGVVKDVFGVHANSLSQIGTNNDSISKEPDSGSRVLVSLLQHSPSDSQVDRVSVLSRRHRLPLLRKVKARVERLVERELDLPDEGELLVEPGVLLPRREGRGGVPAEERRDEAGGLGLDRADGRRQGLCALVRDLCPGGRDEAGKVLVGREDGVGREAAEELCELAGAVDDDLGGEVPCEVLLRDVGDHAGGVEEGEHVVEPQEVAVAAEAVEGLVVAEALRVDGVHDEAAPLTRLRLGIGYLNFECGAGLVVNLGDRKSLKCLELFGHRFVHSIFVFHVSFHRCFFFLSINKSFYFYISLVFWGDGFGLGEGKTHFTNSNYLFSFFVSLFSFFVVNLLLYGYILWKKSSLLVIFFFFFYPPTL